MAKLSQPCILLVLLVFTSGTLLLLPMVKGDICTEDMGGCDADCASRCIAKHSGGKGSCEVSHDPVCRCYYNCAVETCKDSLGFWATGCDNKECNSQCITKFPKPEEEAQGYCYSIAEFVSCICEHKC